jgi:hypothetical protein
MSQSLRLPTVWRALARLVGALLFVTALTLAGVYAYWGGHGLNHVLHGTVLSWTTVAADDARLSAGMRLALQDRSVDATPGAFTWQSVAPGFDVAELPVLADGAEVDRILLTRVDPARFRFIVRNAPAGNRTVDDWMRELGAALVINGSYFTRTGEPDTPVVSAGVRLGPRHYIANHGAFVASRGTARIRDLASEDWHVVLQRADDAMVSYPLLVTRDGTRRVKADPRWLANRSFVGEDTTGRIVLGTTRDAFFSLQRLADFLNAAPLDLALALNLDGGPVASQAVALNGFRRKTCGRFELSAQDDRLSLLYDPAARCSDMPIALAVLPK